MITLEIDDLLVEDCRDLAERIAGTVLEQVARYSTVGVERAVLRLMGVEGTLEDSTPVVNAAVERLQAGGRLGRGAFIELAAVCERQGCSPTDAAFRLAAEGPVPDPGSALGAEEALVAPGLERLQGSRAERERRLERLEDPERPLKYLIVATGDIDEDVTHARAAAEEGADEIAVIRATAQSLLDLVPERARSGGFGGTYANQENFRIMRAALDEASDQTGRYIRQTNYASGLCMAEIATMAGFERLDMMLNDCLYGIIFRDINPLRTFVDQHFSRALHAAAGIVINTGEDNYLTTADAFEKAHTVLASQFVNAAFARRAGLPPDQVALGHAFEIDPKVEGSFVAELAQAQLARQCFPSPWKLKYMPPTKHMTGDVFTAYLHDGMFNLVAHLTGQDVLLLGVMTEAIHTPHLADRHLSLKNADYVRTTTRGLADSLVAVGTGPLEQRADLVLGEAHRALREIEAEGLFAALARGVFADIERPRDGGRGLDGVFERAPGYRNPFAERLGSELAPSPA